MATTTRPDSGTTYRPGSGYSADYSATDYDNGTTPKAAGTTPRPTD